MRERDGVEADADAFASDAPSRVMPLVEFAGRVRESRESDSDSAHRDRHSLLAGAAIFAVPALVLAARADLALVPPATFALAVLAYGAASTVEFEVGSASAVPTEPLLVVMLFLLPPQMVPLATFGGLGLGSWWIRRNHGRSEPILATACSAAHSVGPAVIVAWSESGPPGEHTARLWIVLAAAFVAQVGVDFACSWVRNCFGLGVPVADLLEMLRWSVRVDLLLAPIGIAAALAFPSGPAAVAVASTPVLLLALLARDRRRHIDGLITLSDAFDAASLRARRDQLTGLGNRLAWDESVAIVERHRSAVAVVMLDVDRLKSVNDRFGHEAGDRLIRVVADAARAASPPGAPVCRLGGDEFGILIEGADETEAIAVAAAIEARLAATQPVHDVVVSASIGIAATTNGAVREAMLRADRDIYRHKAVHHRTVDRRWVDPING